MRIWPAVWGEGSEPRVLPPSLAGIGTVESEEFGWRRDAGTLSWDRGESAIYI